MEKLKKLKENYIVLATKYKLPSFRELNEEFEIEKIAEKETELLLRHVRRCILEKIAAISRFFELILNPTEANLLILSLLKDVNAETKKKIEKIYKEVSLIEIASIDLDLDYNEKEEAKFISSVSKDWKKLKTGLKEVSKQLGASWHFKDVVSEGYFG